MIKYMQTDYTTNQKEEVIVGVGTTLYVANESIQVMSDIWEYVNMAYYWNTETNSMNSRIVSYESYEENIDCTVDADHEQLFPVIHQQYLDNEFKVASQNEEQKAMNPSVKGRVVKVVKGKTSVGVEGKVVAVKEMYYGKGYYSTLRNKLAVALDDEMTTFTAKNGKEYPCHKNVVWVWDLNCEVVNPTPDYNHARHVATVRAQQSMDNLKSYCKKFMKVVS